MKEPIFISVILLAWRATLQQGAAVSQGAAAASHTSPSTAIKMITPARHREQPSAFYMMPGGNLRSEMDLEHLREKPGGWEAIQRQNNRGMRAHSFTPPPLPDLFSLSSSSGRNISSYGSYSRSSMNTSSRDVLWAIPYTLAH